MFEAWLQGHKLDMRKVPYRNAVDAGRDLAENRVQAYQSAVAIAQPQIELGKIKLLALLNSVRTPAYPNIPTVAEAGHPGLTIDGLVGLFGHPFMPMELRERIAADIKEVMEGDPIVKDRLTRNRATVQSGRARRIRRLDRNPARHGHGRCQRARHVRQAVDPDRYQFRAEGEGAARSSVRQPSAMMP